ncbi:RICIN domain-containing protein [Dactylosporangium sp. CS-033363]|uniref:RICIN domain-containing protein n=1 Tax=Dactylosporangium sp. CS-033363 TaxID=3239935 RepID=UPI003D8E0964
MHKRTFVATAIATLVAVLFAASPAGAADLNWRHFVGNGSGRCLDVDTNTNWKVQLWSCDSGADESWGLQYVGTAAGGVDFYNLVNKRTNTCLGISGDSSSSGVAAVMSACNSGHTQWWYFPDKTGPSTRIINIWTGLCLDARGNGTGNGTIVQQYTCNGTTAQSWKDVDVP